jgi:hypothetical protein
MFCTRAGSRNGHIRSQCVATTAGSCGSESTADPNPSYRLSEREGVEVEMSLGAERARQIAESDAIPVLRGSTAQMCDRLEWLRQQFGISYILVSDQLMDALAPVISRLAGR